MMRIQKATFEIEKRHLDRLRQMRETMRIEHDLPVTQRLIIEYLIEHADERALRKYFSLRLTRRLGAEDAELREQRRNAYQARGSATRRR